MLLLNFINIALPLKNPVLIFALILFIILFAPILLNKLRIPHLIGLIIAGTIVGPNGFNIILRDSSIELFGTVGLLYIMFLAGLEIDLADFKRNSGKSIIFGSYTFLLPMIIGTLICKYFLNFSLQTSVLLASMFASHTLITYPIVSKLGISKNKAVNITIGGTVITDTLALLVLAIIVEMKTGITDNSFWIKMGISILVFGLIVLFGFPIIGRSFFKRNEDHIAQYVFVLGMVFLAAFFAELSGIEAIIGAFLAGLAFNRLIPQTSPLMNRINFIGNALFIPFFLIGVGMMVNFKSFYNNYDTLVVAATMTIVAIFTKYFAAWLTQKTFNFSRHERTLIFGLSNARVAATLAAILVAYNVVLGYTPEGEPIRLLNDSVLNGAVLMILVTVTVASFATQKGAQKIALLNEDYNGKSNKESNEKILIPISNPETISELINLSITIKSKDNKTGLYALSIITDTNDNENEDNTARKILKESSIAASSTDNKIYELLRYDLNIVNGISNVVKEYKITDLVLGLHSKKGISDTFLGNLTEGILTRCNTTTFIYKPFQPLSTIKRHIIIVPSNAEKELGFFLWLLKLCNMVGNTGTKLVFYGSTNTLNIIQQVFAKYSFKPIYIEFSNWKDFLILSRDIKQDDSMWIVLSRKNHISYNNSMPKIPIYLNKYFKKNNFILVFPMQSNIESQIGIKRSTLEEPFRDLETLRMQITKLFHKNKK